MENKLHILDTVDYKQYKRRNKPKGYKKPTSKDVNTVNFGSGIYGISLTKIAEYFNVREEKAYNIISQWQKDKNLKVLYQPDVQSNIYISKAFYSELQKQKEFMDGFICDHNTIKRNIISFDREYNKAYVYFLIENDEIIYIGQSVDLLRRIETHSKDKEFDQVSIYQVHENYLDIAEMINIVTYNPRLNSQKWGNGTFLKRIIDMCDEYF
jgi:hypothetical protein